MRQGLKQALEQAAVRSGLTRLLSTRGGGDRLILAYHNVVPDGVDGWGERALHMPLARFREHLAVLQAVSEVVPLRALLEGPPTDDDRPRVALTFDDGYLGAVTLGARALAEAECPATFFVNPGLAGELDGFWWDRVAEATGGIMPGEVRKHCLEALAGRQDRVMTWNEAEGFSAGVAPSYARPASEEELDALETSPWFDLQPHTWTHPNLAAISVAERIVEMERGAEWISRRGGTAPWALSYPYGLDSEEVHRSLEAAGYRWGIRVEGGWMPADGAGRFSVPRMNVPAGLSPEGLRIRLSGVGSGAWARS